MLFANALDLACGRLNQNDEESDIDIFARMVCGQVVRATVAR